MRNTLALLSVLGTAAAQGVTNPIAPKAGPPSGCQTSASGTWYISVDDVVVPSSKRDNIKRDSSACAEGNLVVALSNGVLTDAKNRQGYIASNYQFQFDGPPQAGAIYTSGFSVCGNGSVALGGTTTFYKCQSGSFWNLYDRSWAAQCSPVQLVAYACGAADPPGQAGQGPDGQPVATQVVTTTLVKPIGDGQPQVITTTMPVPMCQIGDGQVQVHTTPCASITTTPKPVSTVAPVSQYSDGQIQVTPPGKPPVSQISDGQPQVSSAKPAPTTSAAAPPPPPPPASSSKTIVVPPLSPASSQAPTMPPPVVSNSTMVVSSAPAKTSSAAATTTPAAATTSAPTVPTAAADRVLVGGSVLALIVGAVGVVAFL